MSKVTLNGREIERADDFTTYKNGELNWLLGTNGAPKYSDGAMKNKTKNMLADELRDLVASIPEARAKAPRSTGVGRGHARPPSVSKTKAVAQSKKCNLLKALVLGKTTPEHIQRVLKVDDVLRDYWKTAEQDMLNAQSGVRPKVAMAQIAAAEVSTDVEAPVIEPEEIDVELVPSQELIDDLNEEALLEAEA